MATILNPTAFDALLKQLYGKEKLGVLGYAENAFFAMVPKDENFKGSSKKIPVRVGGPQGIAGGGGFATAQANIFAQEQFAFYITRGKVYGVARVDGETLLASQGNEGAFIDALTDSIDRGIMAVSEEIARLLYGDGYGVLGQGDSSYDVTADEITLANSEDALKFWPGMTLKFSSLATGASLRAGTVTVDSVDRINGTVTCTGNIDAGIAAAVNSDYIYREGVTTRTNQVYGLAAWLPAGAVRSTQLAASFFQVTRSDEPDLLGGIVYDGSGDSIEEAILQAASQLGKFGGKPEVALMSFDNYADLIASLGSKIQYVDMKASDAEVFFPGVKIWTPTGVIKAVADRFCPSDRIYLLNLKEWKLHSLGKAPMILDHDGFKNLRIHNDDGIEIRIGMYGQLACYAPGHQAVITR